MDLQELIAKGKEKLLSMGIRQWGMILLAGICCLVIVFPTKKEEKEPQKENSNSYTDGYQNLSIGQETDYIRQLESRLEEILSAVKDIGRVKVMITANRTVQKNVLQDEKKEWDQMTEMDSAGGSRTSVSEKKEGTTVFYDIAGENIPYILSETYPEVIGVVVIAQGSGVGRVDMDILNAVQVLFDVPAHKIRIMKMK